MKSYKTPILDWKGKRVLWLGTSIPSMGVLTGDSYPELFGRIMGCSVTNMSWAGSHATWEKNPADESCATNWNVVKGLSATARELQSKVNNATPGSAYYPSCDPATDPVQMSYENRINVPFASTPFDVVFINHGHNDRVPDPALRDAAKGTLNPTPVNIVSVTKGVQTTVLLSSAAGLSVYDTITVRTPGITKLDYWTGEIVDITNNYVTFNCNSSSFAGTYASGGSLVKYDKSKLYDAWNLIISDIYNMSNRYGDGSVKIILVTDPSHWKSTGNDGSLEWVAQIIKDVGNKWSLPVYDLGSDLGIEQGDLYAYLGDGTHPTTYAQRYVIAKHIAKWAQGGVGEIPSSNSWTPTLYNVQNVAQSTPFSCTFSVADGVATISGQVNIKPAAAGPVLLGMSVPIPSDFTAYSQAAGIGFCDTTGQTFDFSADVPNNRLSIGFNASSTTNQAFFFVGTMRIL